MKLYFISLVSGIWWGCRLKRDMAPLPAILDGPDSSHALRGLLLARAWRRIKRYAAALSDDRSLVFGH